jgi:hypothetical protein
MLPVGLSSAIIPPETLLAAVGLSSAIIPPETLLAAVGLSWERASLIPFFHDVFQILQILFNHFHILSELFF